MVDENEYLHQLPHNKNVVCPKCGRKYPETILNLEGRLHHGTKPVCIDTKSCERIARKKRRKK